MKKPEVFLIAAITADGFIARETEQFADWSSKEDKQLFVKLTKEAGVMVMGRTTFELFPQPLPGRKHIVYTHSSENESTENVIFTHEKPAKLLSDLSAEGYESVAIIGGQQLYDTFLQAGVIDELYLVVEPYLFGTGISLLKTGIDVTMKLLEAEKLNDNTIVLHYQLEK